MHTKLKDECIFKTYRIFVLIIQRRRKRYLELKRKFHCTTSMSTANITWESNVLCKLHKHSCTPANFLLLPFTLNLKKENTGVRIISSLRIGRCFYLFEQQSYKRAELDIGEPPCNHLLLLTQT